MKNKFKLGLVAQITNSKENPIKSKDWAFFMNFFRERGDVIMFDWKTLDENFKVPRYAKGYKDSIKIVEEEIDIRDSCDIIYIGQLGKIHESQEEFMNFLNILEDFTGNVINPIKTIKANLSKQYLIDLQEKNIPVVPTLDVDSSFTINDIKNLKFPNYGKTKDGIVLKPKVFGEQGKGVIKLEDLKNDQELKSYIVSSGEIIAQPLIKDIYTKGENSFIFLGKEYSHGVNKITGEFKINFDVNSKNETKYDKASPTKKELELCNNAINSLNSKFEYLRIDIIPGDNPLISEIEMVNPAGYLEEVDAHFIYSEKLNKRLNNIFDMGDKKWM